VDAGSGGGDPRPLSGFAGARVHAIAGIGHPARFFEALRTAGIEVDGHDFPDHHGFTAAQLKALPRPLLMTEKDAVKCRELALEDAWSVGVEAQLQAGFFAALDAKLETVARRG
jgi:tetraacyldisaccharide 4'-kinase